MLYTSINVVFLCDQDALFFFRTFFSDVSGGGGCAARTSGDVVVGDAWPPEQPPPSLTSMSPKHPPPQPVMNVGGAVPPPTHPSPDPQELMLMFDEMIDENERSFHADTPPDEDVISVGDADVTMKKQPVFFK